MVPPSQLYDALWEDNERLKEQLQEAELKVTQLRLELERVTQVGGEGEARGGGRGGGLTSKFWTPPPSSFYLPPLSSHLSQRQERIAERPALLELERFVSGEGPPPNKPPPPPQNPPSQIYAFPPQERRALERKAAELEEELKVRGGMDGVFWMGFGGGLLTPPCAPPAPPRHCRT